MHPQKQMLSPETTSVVCIYDTDGCRSPVPPNCIAALSPAEISPNLVIVSSSSWSFLKFCLSHENAIFWFHRSFSGSIRLSMVLYPRVLPYALCWCFIGPGSCPRCGSFGSDPGMSFPAFWISKRPRRWRLTLRYCVEGWKHRMLSFLTRPTMGTLIRCTVWSAARSRSWQPNSHLAYQEPASISMQTVSALCGARPESSSSLPSQTRKGSTPCIYTSNQARGC